jgi:hypothetical protein
VECEKHKKAVAGGTSSAKVASIITKSGSKSDDSVLTAEGAFHTLKYHSSYKTADYTSVLFSYHILAVASFENFLSVDVLSFRN